MLGESLYLQRLINDLLDLSKLQNPDFRMEMQELDLRDVLCDAVRSASQLAREKNVAIRQTCDGPAPRLAGDYGRLRQMFLIVLDNAVKFSPPGSDVTVTLEDSAVTIRDRGAGITEEDLPHIFDRFYKTRSEENKSGSGLGLAIARQIAERHHIELSAESRPGEGASFRFAFRQEE
jgi:signal transduction histidine kinase